ncbi:MAG: hypothetical protein U0Q16_25820 [Bryobacteraceae bacterium]
MQTGTAVAVTRAPAPPPVPAFRYEEVRTGILDSARGRLELVLGFVLAPSPLALPLLLSLMSRIALPPPPPPPKPREPRYAVHVIVLGAPPAERRAEKKPPPERTRVHSMLPITDDAGSKSGARISLRFCPDPEQILPAALAAMGGSVAFAENGLIRRRFVPPAWTESPVQPDDVSLRSHYPLTIVEHPGRYRFLEGIRRRAAGGEPPLTGLAAYALVSWDKQTALETMIEQAASGQCSATDRVRGTVCLDAASGFRLSRIECVRAGPGGSP